MLFRTWLKLGTQSSLLCSLSPNGLPATFRKAKKLDATHKTSCASTHKNSCEYPSKLKDIQNLRIRTLAALTHFQSVIALKAPVAPLTFHYSLHFRARENVRFGFFVVFRERHAKPQIGLQTYRTICLSKKAPQNDG